MAYLLDTTAIHKTSDLLGHILYNCKIHGRVQFLVDAGQGEAVVQRLRVALSRSRKRNLRAGKLTQEFTLRHQSYPYSLDGRRKECLVMWTEKNQHHVVREILDDLVERN